MSTTNPWLDPKAPPPGLSLPVSMGPIALPPAKQKRPLKWLVIWTVLVFAVGVAAGPTLIEEGSRLIAGACAMVGMHVPQFIAKASSKSSSAEIAPATASLQMTPGAPGAATPTAVAALAVEARNPAPSQPVLPQVEKLADTGPAPATPSARQPAGHASHAAGPADPAHASHGKGGGKTVASADEPSPSSGSTGRKGGGGDPFESDSDNSEPVVAAPSRKSKAAEESSSKSESSRASKSSGGDSLDSLMADMGGDSKGKSSSSKRSKEIDAMLKDVQKSNPEPAPKPRETETSTPSLTSSDISKAMAGVKARSSDCSRTGQKGTAELKITVGKDGRVSDVRLSGKLAGTPAGECVERATRAASFPPSAGLRFDYRIDVR